MIQFRREVDNQQSNNVRKILSFRFTKFAIEVSESGDLKANLKWFTDLDIFSPRYVTK